jgi:DNA-binding XRE family transcriptional regulator
MTGKNWKEVRAAARELREPDSERMAALTAQMLGEVRAYRLAEVRKSQHVSQAALAQAMGVSQPRVSAIERGVADATELGTIRTYVEALGGRMRIVADFGDQSVTLAG